VLPEAVRCDAWGCQGFRLITQGTSFPSFYQTQAQPDLTWMNAMD
jgi:hypothetical protein